MPPRRIRNNQTGERFWIKDWVKPNPPTPDEMDALLKSGGAYKLGGKEGPQPLPPPPPPKTPGLLEQVWGTGKELATGFAQLPFRALQALVVPGAAQEEYQNMIVQPGQERGRQIRAALESSAPFPTKAADVASQLAIMPAEAAMLPVGGIPPAIQEKQYGKAAMYGLASLGMAAAPKVIPKVAERFAPRPAPAPITPPGPITAPNRLLRSPAIPQPGTIGIQGEAPIPDWTWRKFTTPGEVPTVEAEVPPTPPPKPALTENVPKALQGVPKIVTKEEVGALLDDILSGKKAAPPGTLPKPTPPVVKPTAPPTLAAPIAEVAKVKRVRGPRIPKAVVPEIPEEERIRLELVKKAAGAPPVIKTGELPPPTQPTPTKPPVQWGKQEPVQTTAGMTKEQIKEQILNNMMKDIEGAKPAAPLPELQPPGTAPKVRTPEQIRAELTSVSQGISQWTRDQLAPVVKNLKVVEQAFKLTDEQLLERAKAIRDMPETGVRTSSRAPAWKALIGEIDRRVAQPQAAAPKLAKPGEHTTITPEQRAQLDKLSKEISGTLNRDLTRPGVPPIAERIKGEKGALKIGPFGKEEAAHERIVGPKTGDERLDAEMEAVHLGIDSSQFKTLDDLKFAITRTVAREIYRTGKNPLTDETWARTPDHWTAEKGGPWPEAKPNETLSDLMKRKIREPEAARTAEGGVKIGANVERLGKILGTSLYKGEIPTVVTKELVQNSLTAIRGKGPAGKIEVNYSDYDKYVTVSDNGPGMTRAEVDTVLTDLGESGTVGQEGSIGGFGLAKAAPYLGGKRSRTVTVAREPKTGKLKKIVFEGTPDELLRGVPLTPEERPGQPFINESYVPEGTETGTTTTVWAPPHSQYMHGIREFVNELGKHSDFPGKVALQYELKTGEGRSLGYPMTEISKGTAGRKFITNVKSPSADVSLYVPAGEGIGKASSIDVKIMNKGMFQGTQTMYLPSEVRDIPSSIIADVTPKVTEGHADYPFTANREQLRGSAWEAVQTYVKENVIKPALEAKVKEVQGMYNSMKISPVSGRKVFYYDAGEKFTPTEFQRFLSSDSARSLSKFIVDATHEAIESVKNDFPWAAELGNRLERVGIIFDETLRGIHIPNPTPGSMKSTILINPWQLMSRRTPRQAAGGILHTIQHEIAHMPEGGHEERFCSRLGDLHEFFAENSIRWQSRITHTIEGVQGGYTPEIQELLRVYNEARRRGGTTQDILLRSGTKSAAPAGGQAGIPRTNQPAQTRTPAERVEARIEREYPLYKPRGAVASTTENVIGRSILGKFRARGPAGKSIADTVEHTRREYEILYGTLEDKALNVIKTIGKKNWDHFIDVIEGTARPNATEARMVPIYEAINKVVENRMVNSGAGFWDESGKHVPWRPMESNYYPHIYPSLSKLRSILQPAELNRVIKARLFGERRISPQFERETNAPGWRRDPGSWLTHLYQMSKRSVEAKNYGPLDIAGKNTPLTRLIEATEEPEVIREGLRRILGREPPPGPAGGALAKVAGGAIKLESATKLSRFVINNVNQISPVLLRTNTMDFIGAVKKFLTQHKAAKSRARTAGALIPAETDVLTEAGGPTTIAKMYGIRASESGLRTIAANAGMDHAIRLFKNAKRTGSERLWEQLSKRVGVPADVLKRQNELTSMQVKRAGHWTSEVTQGRAQPQDLPYYWSSGPAANILSLYKRYAYRQAKIMYDALKENPARNIPIALVAFQVMGELTGDITAAITGATKGTLTGKGPVEGAKESIESRGEYMKNIAGNNKVMRRVLDNYMRAWFFGLPGEIVQAASEGDRSVYRMMAGPILDDVVTLITGTGEAAKKIYKGKMPIVLPKAAVRSIPIFGSGVAQAAYGKKKKTTSELGNLPPP